MKRINSREQLLKQLESHRTSWIFLYAPMCGTCNLARSFIAMVEKVKEDEFVYEIDLSLCKNEAYDWQIQSVPCLVKFSNSHVDQKLYAFESVSTVFEFINK